MQAVRIHEHGELDVLRIEEIPDPTAGPHQVLIEVKAIGLNHLDTWVRRGVEGHEFPLPITPGCDFAGVVKQVGEGVQRISVGDRVLAAPGFSCGRCQACASGNDQLCRWYGIFGETTDGGCAELAVIPAVNAVPIPEHLSFEQAAAFPLTFLTAWHMLVARCGIRETDDVLIHAAGSGVSVAAIQIAKMFHTRVIATAGSDDKLEKARALGADHVVNYSTDDFVAVVKDITRKRGVDIVVDHVGESTIGKSLRCLAKGGRLVTCGATAGPKLQADLRPIFFKSLSILGSTMGSRGELLHLVKLVADGVLKPVIDRVLPMDQVRDAHRALGQREQFGKIVLVPGGTA